MLRMGTWALTSLPSAGYGGYLTGEAGPSSQREAKGKKKVVSKNR